MNHALESICETIVDNLDRALWYELCAIACSGDPDRRDYLIDIKESALKDAWYYTTSYGLASGQYRELYRDMRPKIIPNWIK